MDEPSRAHLLAELEVSEAEFLGVLAGVSEEEARFRVGEESWTILDCVEHTALVEAAMCSLISSKYEVLAEPLRRPAIEAKLSRNVLRRDRKVEAPEKARPKSRFTTLAEATDHFRQVRSSTGNYVISCTDDLRSRTMMHPVAGKLTCFECLLMIVRHPLRHAAQIREIREQWRARESG
jgi:DinB superfamily